MISKVIARETISSVSSSTGFTATNIPPANVNVAYALVQALSGAIRVCEDGTTPTATKGIKFNIEESFEIWGAEALENFRAIDDGGTASLEVIYFGRGG